MLGKYPKKDYNNPRPISREAIRQNDTHTHTNMPQQLRTLQKEKALHPFMWGQGRKVKEKLLTCRWNKSSLKCTHLLVRSLVQKRKRECLAVPTSSKALFGLAAFDSGFQSIKWPAVIPTRQILLRSGGHQKQAKPNRVWTVLGPLPQRPCAWRHGSCHAHAASDKCQRRSCPDSAVRRRWTMPWPSLLTSHLLSYPPIHLSNLSSHQFFLSSSIYLCALPTSRCYVPIYLTYVSIYP